VLSIPVLVGGKTLHIAALMENRQLIAMDLYESKLKQLKIRAKRDGVNIEYRIDTTKVIKNTKSRSCFD
jgi:16S rRNA (cytosine967-C5)-methyltransferase